MRKSALLLCVVAALAGCQNTPLNDKVPLDVGLRETSVDKVDWNKTRLVINAEVTLRGKDAATYDSADYTLSVGGARVATGSMQMKVPLVPGEPTIIGLPIEVNYLRLLDEVQKHRECITPSGDLAATLTGTIYAKGQFSSMMLPGEPTKFESPVSIPLKAENWSGGFPRPLTPTLPPR